MVKSSFCSITLGTSPSQENMLPVILKQFRICALSLAQDHFNTAFRYESNSKHQAIMNESMEVHIQLEYIKPYTISIKSYTNLNLFSTFKNVILIFALFPIFFNALIKIYFNAVEELKISFCFSTSST